MNSAQIKVLRRGGYNPSLFHWNGSLLMSYRHHRPGSWMTNLRMVELSNTFEVVSDKPVQLDPSLSRYSHEDARLFAHDGKLHASYTLGNAIDRSLRSITGYGVLVTEKDCWRVDCVLPSFGHNDWSGFEKNWVFFSRGRLTFIYRSNPFHVVVEIDDDGKVCNSTEIESPVWRWGEIRGGTSPIDVDGVSVRFFHSRLNNVYHIGAAVVRPEFPFDMMNISRRPIISGKPHPRCQVPHFKPCVVIPYGAVAGSDGRIFLSYGVNDCHCFIATLTMGDLVL